MGLSDYNGFPGKMREAVGRRQAKAWSAGTMPKPSRCEACGQTEGAIHGHAEDYSREDVYLPLCITCHLILHMRFREPKLWVEYKEWVRGGWQGPALEQSNGLHQIKRLYPASAPETWEGRHLWDARTATVLDMIAPVKFIHPNAPTTQDCTVSCAISSPDSRKTPFDTP